MNKETKEHMAKFERDLLEQSSRKTRPDWYHEAEIEAGIPEKVRSGELKWVPGEGFRDKSANLIRHKRG